MLALDRIGIPSLPSTPASSPSSRPPPAWHSKSTPFALGDAVLSVNGRPVHTRSELRRRLLETPAPWVVQVEREGVLRFLVVAP